jgi:hypothetical protein
MASAVEKERFDNSSNDEKIVDGTIAREHVDPNSDIADPDAGLSEEERVAAVSSYIITNIYVLISTAGPQASMETGPEAHSMVVLPLSHLLPRSDEYW